MARRDQPYLPLYVNDFLSDEKLNNCSAEATGVYIRLMCLMHKSNEYGVISLKDRDIKRYESQANRKQISEKSQANHEQGSANHIQIFTEILRRHMPYSEDEIESGLIELIDEGVIEYEDTRILQPRMVRDAEISEVRAKAGSAGGKAAKNLSTKKNYNEHGFLYVAEDSNDESCHKVGITKNLRNRLNGLCRQSQRKMKFVFTCEVDDMGTTEDNVLTFLNNIRDGEWIYGHPLSEIMKAVNHCVKIPSKSQANRENEIDIIYETENENKLNDSDKEFDIFWSAYPKKVGKVDAKKKFKTALTKASLDTMLAALEVQKTWSQWQRDGGQYIPNASTWLNQERWDDEETPQIKGQRSGSPKTFLDMYREMEDEE